MNLDSLTNHSIALIQEFCTDDHSITCAFSGAEDIVVLDLIQRTTRLIPVFAVDTARLHPETLAYVHQVQQHFNLDLTWIKPNPDAVAAFERQNGRFSFYEDGHLACCNLRKTEPLRAHLAHFDGWLTGLRRDQNPTRGAPRPLFYLYVRFYPRDSLSLEASSYLEHETSPSSPRDMHL